jgi:peptide/nickel transport system ATP-binding protein
VREVTKDFVSRRRGRGAGSGAHRAVDGVSFTVEAGGALGIAGESGSGKTTLARIIAGAASATSGEIVVAGRPYDVTRARTVRRREYGRMVQMVYQDPYLSLDPRQTVSECLDEILRFQSGGSKASRRGRVRELLDMVGLASRHVSSRPGALSGGQRQRVAIARALASAPSILLLDEAVSALDVSVQGQILNLLADLREATSVTYVFISHNLAVIRQVCDDIIVMENGRVVERGATAQVLAAPQSDYTRELLACIPGPGWRPPARVVPLVG